MLIQWILTYPLDSSIHWITHHPLNKSIGFDCTYPVDSDSSPTQHYPTFEQLKPGTFLNIKDQNSSQSTFRYNNSTIMNQSCEAIQLTLHDKEKDYTNLKSVEVSRKVD